MAHEPLALELPEGVELLLGGHLGVDAVELVEIDTLEPEAAETSLELTPEMVGPPVGHPLVRPRAEEASLGGDDQSLGIGVQRLGDDLFGDVGTVGVRGVDE